eukprot:gene6490-7780_t
MAVCHPIKLMVNWRGDFYVNTVHIILEYQSHELDRNFRSSGCDTHTLVWGCGCGCDYGCGYGRAGFYAFLGTVDGDSSCGGSYGGHRCLDVILSADNRPQERLWAVVLTPRAVCGAERLWAVVLTPRAVCGAERLWAVVLTPRAVCGAERLWAVVLTPRAVCGAERLWAVVLTPRAVCGIRPTAAAEVLAMFSMTRVRPPSAPVGFAPWEIHVAATVRRRAVPVLRRRAVKNVWQKRRQESDVLREGLTRCGRSEEGVAELRPL